MRKEDKKLIEDARTFLNYIAGIAWPDEKTYERYKALARRFDDRVFEPDMVDGQAEKGMDLKINEELADQILTAEANLRSESLPPARGPWSELIERIREDFPELAKKWNYLWSPKP